MYKVHRLSCISKALNNMSDAVQVYKDVLHYDNTHVEAIACIATQHFYTDQPEVALRYFRYTIIYTG
jgi:tetratricopeptide repeat protein 8